MSSVALAPSCSEAAFASASCAERLLFSPESDILLKKADYCSEIAHHNDWMASIMDKYKDINNENIDLIIQDEIGKIFTSILTNAGVFKRDYKGRKAFVKCINFCGTETHYL